MNAKREAPCNGHTSTLLPFMAAQADAAERLRRGEQQVQCPHCLLWLWPHELSAPNAGDDTASEIPVTLSVIVNGVPAQVTEGASRPLRVVMAHALEMTRNIGRPLEEWELRSSKGVVRDPAATVESAVLADDGVFFLNLKSGVGGAN